MPYGLPTYAQTPLLLLLTAHWVPDHLYKKSIDVTQNLPFI